MFARVRPDTKHICVWLHYTLNEAIDVEVFGVAVHVENLLLFLSKADRGPFPEREQLRQKLAPHTRGAATSGRLGIMGTFSSPF